jgi:hypothetical protein
MSPSNRPESPFVPPALSAQAKILSLVLFILLELHGETEALECTPLPLDERYAVRLESRGEIGMAILLPRHLLERALFENAAWRTARDLIRGAVQVLDRRETRHQRNGASAYDAMTVPRN